MKLFLVFLVVAFSSCATQKFYVVRHAEKEQVPAGADRMMAADPPLSSAGNERAEALKSLLLKKKIGYIFSTKYKRTINTAVPLSTSLGIPVQLYSPAPDSLNNFMERLHSLSDKNVLIMAHSNTVDDLSNKLAGKQVVAGDLPETDYDNIFIIRKKGKQLKFERITYGVATN